MKAGYNVQIFDSRCVTKVNVR